MKKPTKKLSKAGKKVAKRPEEAVGIACEWIEVKELDALRARAEVAEALSREAETERLGLMRRTVELDVDLKLARAELIGSVSRADYERVRRNYEGERKTHDETKKALDARIQEQLEMFGEKTALEKQVVAMADYLARPVPGPSKHFYAAAFTIIASVLAGVVAVVSRAF